jgi:acetoin:2,6-dichlorophenolindophenol oxidoreductase subunit alpha
MIGQDPDRDLRWYRKMLEIRLFEERTQELSQQGLIGSTHLAQGQEAVSVGAVSALTDGDYMTYTYRSHAAVLARGMAMEVAYAEMMGRRSGCCGGVGGTMHLTDYDKGLLGAFGIVGASLPVAVGAATSAKLRGTAGVALAFCGDGAANIGTFHEALNMAAVWKAPVVFVVENNLYGEYSPVQETTSVEDLAVRAQSYAIPGVIVDGQVVEEVYAAAATAVERARGGEGPTLIEAKTYRYRGHASRDPGKYRPADELAAWKERDPIEILAAKLVELGALTDEDRTRLHEETQAEVDAAAERAAAAEFPTLEETGAYVYAG